MLAQRKDDYDGYDAYGFAEPQEEPRGEEEGRVAEGFRKKLEEPLFQTVLDTTLRSHLRTLFLVSAVLAMLTTISSGVSASRGYQLIAVQREAEQLEQENERLNIEIAKLKSPERIKSIAESELGMHVPKKTYFAHENP